MDGRKLVQWPKESLERVLPFVEEMMTFRGRKLAVSRYVLGHMRHNRRSYPFDRNLVTGLQLLKQYVWQPEIGSVRQMRQTRRRDRLTYCAMTDSLPEAYRPRRRLDERFRKDFEPLFVTDEAGTLTDVIADDLQGSGQTAPSNQRRRVHERIAP